MKKLSEIFKNICFPKTCMCCENFVEEGGLCENCWEKIKWISEPTCKICGIPLEMDTDFCVDCLENKNHFDKAISVFLYDSISKNIILISKKKMQLISHRIWLNGLTERFRTFLRKSM